MRQAELAELYGTSVPSITQVVARVLADGEVTEATLNSEFMVRQEGLRQVRKVGQAGVARLRLLRPVPSASAGPGPPFILRGRRP